MVELSEIAIAPTHSLYVDRSSWLNTLESYYVLINSTLKGGQDYEEGSREHSAVDARLAVVFEHHSGTAVDPHETGGHFRGATAKDE